MSHLWPSDPEAHLWGPWMSHTSTVVKRTQYRQCVHPGCKAFETRDVPNG